MTGYKHASFIFAENIVVRFFPSFSWNKFVTMLECYSNREILSYPLLKDNWIIYNFLCFAIIHLLALLCEIQLVDNNIAKTTNKSWRYNE